MTEDDFWQRQRYHTTKFLLSEFEELKLPLSLIHLYQIDKTNIHQQFRNRCLLQHSSLVLFFTPEYACTHMQKFNTDILLSFADICRIIKLHVVIKPSSV